MIRLVTSSLAGLLIVGLLFWGLNFAIGQKVEGEGSEAPARIEFTSLMRAKPLDTKKRFKPAPREKPKIDPAAINVAAATSLNRANSPLKMDISSSLLSGEGSTEGGSVTAGDVAAGGRFAGGRADRGLMPIVRVECEYPSNVNRQGVEGWVVVEFTVTTSGSVRDPKVLASQPERVFDQGTQKCVQRWRYSPQVENGEPVEKQVKIKIVYEQGGQG